MAEKTILSSRVQGKPFSSEILDSVGIIRNERGFFVSSTDVAARFQKQHKHVLDEIRRISALVPVSFREPNFRPTFQTVAGPNNSSRKEPMFLLTRDGFTLLAMGFTGKEAMAWKIRYIKAFNELEQALVAAIRSKAYLEGATAAARISSRPRDSAKIKKAVAYREKGLTFAEIGKLLDVHTRKAWDLVQAGAVFGGAI